MLESETTYFQLTVFRTSSSDWIRTNPLNTLRAWKDRKMRKVDKPHLLKKWMFRTKKMKMKRILNKKKVSLLIRR